MAYAPTDTGQRLIDLNQIGVAISTENELFTTAAATATGGAGSVSGAAAAAAAGALQERRERLTAPLILLKVVT